MGFLDGLKRTFGGGFPPQTPFLDAYDIKSEVMSGSMSVMYYARQRQTDELRVIKKVTPKSKESVEALRRELDITLGLAHPRIVRSFGYEKRGDAYYILMEFVLGDSFREYLKKKAVLGDLKPPFMLYRHFVEVFHQIADGLKYMHAKNTLHLDIKPENVMFVKPKLVDDIPKDPKRKKGSTSILRRRRAQETRMLKPESLETKIIDFGISVKMDEIAGASAGGSVFYVAPEVLAGPEVRKVSLGPRSDIYSLGATMYELATGRPPYLPAYFDRKEKNWYHYWPDYLRLPKHSRQNYERDMLAERLSKPPDLDLIPYHYDIKQVLGRCLEAPVPKRYSYTQELIADLDRVIANIAMGRQ